MKNKSQNGFSIYELMITLLIAGVLLTIGIPNLVQFTANSRMSSTANDLHSSFLLARSEAARAKANVTICSSANSMAAAAQCDGGSFDDGWIIFVDVDGDISVDAPPVDPILRRHGPIPDAIDITMNGGAAYFSFAPTGLGRGNVGPGQAIQRAQICDDRGHSSAAGDWSTARHLVVTPIGRATVIRDFDRITTGGGCP